MEPKLTLEVDVVAELASKVDMPVEELTDLKTGFRTLETDIADKTLGNGISPMGATGNYAGVPFEEANLSRNVCGQMKWAHDNTGLRYKPFFKLDFETPTQGIEIWKADVLIDTIEVPITGGLNADPAKQITKDMYTMIGLAVRHAYEYSQNNK